MSGFFLAAAVCGSALAAGDRRADPEDMAAAARSAFADVARRYGPQRLLSIEVHPDEVAIEAQDRAQPTHVDRYRYEAGEPAGSEPVAVGRHRGTLSRRLFPAAAVDMTLLPGMLAAAPAEVRAEEGIVTHAILQREEGEWSWGDPRWRVHVLGPRTGGYVEYSLDGKRKRVFRW